MEEKVEKPKNLYVIKFWRQNNDWDHKLPPVTLMATKHIKPTSDEQALIALKENALKAARSSDRTDEDLKLVSMLFTREDISVTVKQTFDTRILDREEKAEQEEEAFTKSVCRQCGDALDDDYCQACGWRRQSWIEVALSKQGKTTSDIE